MSKDRSELEFDQRGEYVRKDAIPQAISPAAVTVKPLEYSEAIKIVEGTEVSEMTSDGDRRWARRMAEALMIEFNKRLSALTPAPVAGWRSMDSAPYETPVLTFWPGSEKRNPVIVVNTRNNGLNLGEKDTWWQNEQPTHWMPLPPAPGEQPDAVQDAGRVPECVDPWYPSLIEELAQQVALWKCRIEAEKDPTLSRGDVQYIHDLFAAALRALSEEDE